jgi:hypothetical protein
MSFVFVIITHALIVVWIQRQHSLESRNGLAVLVRFPLAQSEAVQGTHQRPGLNSAPPSQPPIAWIEFLARLREREPI